MLIVQLVIGVLIAGVGVWGVLGEPGGRETGPRAGRTIRVVSGVVVVLGAAIAVGALR
jgi:hypothetical protein